MLPGEAHCILWFESKKTWTMLFNSFTAADLKSELRKECKYFHPKPADGFHRLRLAEPELDLGRYQDPSTLGVTQLQPFLSLSDSPSACLSPSPSG